MIDASQVQEHMEIVGSCGNHVGTVDHMQDGRIKLTKNDSADGKHHFLPLSAIASVEGNKLKTSMNHMDAMKQFQDA